MKDNRDPALLGAKLLSEQKRRNFTRSLSGLADELALDRIPSYEHTREPGEPMCGWPPEGKRSLSNGKVKR